jgi:hypothetical protein
MEMPAITDDLLAEIFLLLPNPADVARARAACVSFRRVASERSFILRYRKLHGRPLLGLVDKDGFHPVLPPHLSAPAARDLARSTAADFSFSFLPSPGSWAMTDARDGRFLLERTPEGEETPGSETFNELAVCDPLHRRFLLLPPVPDHLLADLVFMRLFLSEPFLAPSGEAAAEAEETSFRVIWMLQCNANPVVFVFSSRSGQWRASGSRSWSDLLAVEDAPRYRACVCKIDRHYAYGCFYWEFLMHEDVLLVLDTMTMEFSVDLPPAGRDGSRGNIAIVEAEEGRPGMFGLHYKTGDLYYAVKQNNQWQMLEKICVFDPEYIYCMAGATEKYLLLRRWLNGRQIRGCTLVNSTPKVVDYEYFSLDYRTMQLQRICSLKQYHGHLQMYNISPTSLFLPPRTL